MNYVAKRTTANQTAGDELVRNVKTNGDKLENMMIGQVFPAIRSKMRYASKGSVQMDGARSHTKNATYERIKQAAENPEEGQPYIEIIFQPANSPDTNLNDLCFFIVLIRMLISIRDII